VEKACEKAVIPNKVYEPSGVDYSECYKRFTELDNKLF